MTRTLPNPSTFERFTERYRLRAQLETVTALRVGAGKRFEAAATDQPVIRDGLGRPYLPGSSLKGALRAGLERTLRGLDRDDLWACDLFEKPCTEPLQERQKRGEEVPLADVQETVCPACGLFGSSFLAGRIFLHDLPIDEASSRPPEVRDGVGITRDLRTAQGGIKYDFEAVPPGTRFHLEMLLENVDEIQLALALKALELLDAGQILLGGLTTRGLGRVRLRQPELGRIDAAALLAGGGFTTIDYPGAQLEAGSRLGRVLAAEGS